MNEFNISIFSNNLSSYAKDFLENSKLDHYDDFDFSDHVNAINSSEEMIANMINHTCELGNAVRIPLMARNESNARLETLHELGLSRLSSRDFDITKTMDFSELSTLFKTSYFITENNQNRFNVASAGGLNPIEIYFISNRIVGLERGVYHYNPYHNHLEQLSLLNEDELVKVLNVAFSANKRDDIAFHSATGIIILSATINRTTFKYKDRGLRFVFFEIGEILHSIYLNATCLNVKCCANGSHVDDFIGNILELKGFDQIPLLSIAIGK